MNTHPPSPCNLVCTLDAATGLCMGCYRNMDEIAAWPDFSAAQKMAVLEALASRRAFAAAGPVKENAGS